MLQEAEKYKAQDDRHKEVVEAKNALENFVYSMRNTLTELRSTITSEHNALIHNSLNTTLQWIDQNQNAELSDFNSKLQQL